MTTDYAPIPRMTRSDFGLQLTKGARGGRLPLAGTLEVTPYCNLKCAHCYMVRSPWNGHQLACNEVCRILDELAEEGCMWLLLTGGEPFLREDFLEIYTHALKKGFLVSISTNGTLLTDDIVHYLEEWKPLDVEITLYGATRETYQRVTGSAEAFDRCRQAIDLLLKAGVPLQLKTTVMSLNVAEVPEMRTFAQSLGLKFRFDSMITPRLDGSRGVCQVRLSPEEVVRAELEDPEVRKGLTDLGRGYMGPPDSPSDRLFTCGAGQSTFHIDAGGHLHPCVMVTEPRYDLTTGTFRDGFYQFIPSLVSRERTKSSQCQVCSDRGVCQICPGWAQLETAHLEERPVPYLCQVAYLRARAISSMGKEDSLPGDRDLSCASDTGRERGQSS